MGTAESRYDKISDFHKECQGLFGHLLCAAQLSGLSETHGKSTCTHYFRQHGHGSVFDPHSHVFKGEVLPKEATAELYDAFRVPFCWYFYVRQANYGQWDVMLSSRLSAPFIFKGRGFPPALMFNNHTGRAPSLQRQRDLLLHWGGKNNTLVDQNAAATRHVVIHRPHCASSSCSIHLHE